jgi:hypothetical protein
MDIETFLSQYKGKSQVHTGTIATKLKVTVDSKRTTFWVRDGESRGIKVNLKEPKEHLTIFEVALLYNITKQKLPIDYANYHKCQAGKEFIDNIESITLLQYSKAVIEGRVIK